MRVAFVINVMFNLSTKCNIPTLIDSLCDPNAFVPHSLLTGKSHPVNEEVAVAVAVAVAAAGGGGAGGGAGGAEAGAGAGAGAGAVAVALLDVFNEGAHCWEEISSYI